MREILSVGSGMTQRVLIVTRSGIKNAYLKYIIYF